MYRNEVVGFDAREMWLDVDSQWTQSQRDAFLLRQDVLKPLSVDSYIWYSVFSELLAPRLWLSVKRRPQYLGGEWNTVFSEARKPSIPDSYRPRRAWRNLALLQNHLQETWGNLWKPCCLVAIAEVISNEVDTDEEYEGPEPISPKAVDSQWQLLGYDVADYELYTGLFNGVITPDEAAKLRHDWEPYLNENHLFSEPEKAFDYITVANRRYPSHIPYCTYALYRIPEQ
jgi:hypothetical protein